MSVDAVVSALARVARNSAPSEDHPELAGHFANVIDIGDVKLAIGTDGVGTKLLLATEPEHFRGLAVDCAAMNANDLICVGAVPLAIVDYVACASADDLEPYAAAIADGFVDAEEQGAGGVVGGEVAVLPEIIASRPDGVPGLDLAATAVGMVEGELLDGSAGAPGDAVVAIASNGPHSNGFTALRRLLEDEEVDLDGPAPWGGDGTTREQLLTPTMLYPRLMAVLAGRDLHAAANITGGGVTNLARVLPTCGARIDAWPALPPLFEWIAARVSPEVAYETFNMGVGFMVVVDGAAVDDVLDVVPPAFGATVIGRLTADLVPGTLEVHVGGVTLTGDRKRLERV